MRMSDGVKLAGFVHEYGDDDYSVWFVELDDEDARAIDEVLARYEADGWSVRGDINRRGWE